MTTRKKSNCEKCGVRIYDIGNRDIKTCPGCNNSLTKEEVIRKLKELENENGVVKDEDLSDSLSWCIYRYFPSFNEAKEELGLKKFQRKGMKVPKQQKDFDEPDELTPKIGYVLSALYGDGTIRYRKRDGEIIGGVVKFSSTDKDFFDKFVNYLEDFTGFEVYMNVLERGGNKKSKHWAELNFYQLVKYLKSMDFNNIRSSKREVKVNFIQGFIDSEGCIDRCGIRVGNTNKDYLELLKDLLGDLDIYSYIRKQYDKHPLYDDVKTYFMLYIGRNSEVKKFYEKVGFSIGRKDRKLGEYVENIQHFEIQWTKDKIVKKLNTLAKKLGHSPTQKECREKNQGLCGACKRYFGSWNNAKEVVGLETL